MLPKLQIKLFAGPSLNERIKLLARRKNVEIVAPIRRFDIPKILESGFLGCLAIADGYFYQDMSVGHAEIIEAMNKGCVVYGLSSMGAIRAYEMHSYGVIGFGKVFEWFFSEEDFQDDEVALLHGEAPEYIKISEPLVHFRECLKQLSAKGKIDHVQEDNIVTELKTRFFGERKLKLFQKLINEFTSLNGQEVISDFDKYRIKTIDLEQFLTREPWNK